MLLQNTVSTKTIEVDFGICDFSYKTPMNDVRIYACDKKDGSGKIGNLFRLSSYCKQ